MRNFQDTFETRKRSFISTFSICMTVPLSKKKHDIRKVRDFIRSNSEKRDIENKQNLLFY